MKYLRVFQDSILGAFLCCLLTGKNKLCKSSRPAQLRLHSPPILKQLSALLLDQLNTITSAADKEELFPIKYCQ